MITPKQTLNTDLSLLPAVLLYTRSSQLHFQTGNYYLFPKILLGFNITATEYSSSLLFCSLNYYYKCWPCDKTCVSVCLCARNNTLLKDWNTLYSDCPCLWFWQAKLIEIFFIWILATCCDIMPLYDKFHKVILWRDTHQQTCSKVTGNREI